jgi:hypothetical protein
MPCGSRSVKGYTVQGHQPPHCASRETEEANMSPITIDLLHHANDYPSGRYITQVRATKSDKELMRQAAATLGMPLGAFLRVVGMQVAVAVLDPFNEQGNRSRDAR